MNAVLVNKEITNPVFIRFYRGIGFKSHGSRRFPEPKK